ncbi:MEDS domain-containing protein [Salinispira pacifica]|uniref:Sensory transduction histidine kinase n=1 Tax=Salinispira pacifica TaxID=1307761 RepID=V5WEU0_9SPIO|nr:MEDS domain-containing protein [Salinispira pacifica]AHC14049.1 sensory transduction histidine kinase [Salinispira pacifica]
MCTVARNFDLGFGHFHGEPGLHVCQIYSDSDERLSALMKFIKGGGSIGEKISLFTDAIGTDQLRTWFSGNSMGYEADSPAVSITDPRETYFENGTFNPDTMLERLKKFYLTATEEGYPAARVIGDMLPEVETIDGGDRLTEYESRVSLLQREHPVTTVCQYDAGKFSGKTIMEILQVHPYILSGGEIIENPLFISPEDYLTRIGWSDV